MLWRWATVKGNAKLKWAVCAERTSVLFPIDFQSQACSNVLFINLKVHNMKPCSNSIILMSEVLCESKQRLLGRSGFLFPVIQPQGWDRSNHPSLYGPRSPSIRSSLIKSSSQIHSPIFFFAMSIGHAPQRICQFSLSSLLIHAGDPGSDLESSRSLQ